MKILVSNDDGIDAPGLIALVKELRKIGEVTVSAPDSQRSASGHALMIDNPLKADKRYREGELFGYAVNGMPADCVRLGMYAFCDGKPDVVVSGINHGKNTSKNIFYSGTAAAASEGMLAGIPSLAVSLDTFDYNFDCSIAARAAVNIVAKMPGLNLPNDTFLNMNVPAVDEKSIQGIKITSLSNADWTNVYEKRVDPFGREYYWFSGEYISADNEIGSDDEALSKNFISITPIRFSFTNSEFINKLDVLK